MATAKKSSTTPSTSNASKAASAPQANDKSPANGKPGKKTDPAAALMEILAGQWSSELRAVASTTAHTAQDVRAMRLRLSKIIDAMREVEKAVGA